MKNCKNCKKEKTCNSDMKHLYDGCYTMFIPKETKIKYYRKLRNLTQKELSEKSGIYISQVRKMDTGEIKARNITGGSLMKLAKALKVTIEELLEE